MQASHLIAPAAFQHIYCPHMPTNAYTPLYAPLHSMFCLLEQLALIMHFYLPYKPHTQAKMDLVRAGPTAHTNAHLKRH